MFFRKVQEPRGEGTGILQGASLMASFESLQELYSAHSAEKGDVRLDAPAKTWGKQTSRESFFPVSRFSRGVATPTCTATLLAVVLASLTAAYFLLICYRHLSAIFSKDGSTRVLASHLPDEDSENKCSIPASKSDQDDIPANHASGPATLQALPPMPREVQKAMAEALHLLTEPVYRCLAVLMRVYPGQRRKLIYHLTLLAAVELSGFAFLPAPLQPLRTLAARQYLELNRKVLKVKPSPKSLDAVAMLLQIVKNLGEPPTRSYEASPGLYERMMVIQYRLFQLANFNALKVLDDLLMTAPNATGFVPAERVKRAVNLLKELYRVRRSQILRQRLTRIWLGAQQERLETQMIYNTILLRDAKTFPIRRVDKEYEQIFEAVRFAGGEPVSPFPLDYLEDSAETTDSDADMQQAVEPPRLDLGARGFPGSISQESPQDAVGDAAASASTTHQAEPPSSAQTFPSGFMNQFPVGNLPGLSLDYGLYGFSTGAGVGNPEAGHGGAVHYVGTTAQSDQAQELPGVAGIDRRIQGHPQFPSQQPPKGATGVVAPFASHAQQGHVQSFIQPAPKGVMGVVAPFAPTTQQATLPLTVQLPSGLIHDHPSNFLQVPARAVPYENMVGTDDEQHSDAAHEAGAAGFEVAQSALSESTPTSTGDDGVPSGQSSQEDFDLQEADQLLKLIDAAVNWNVTSDEEDW